MEQRQDKWFDAVADCLEYRDDDEQKRINRNGNTQYPQEFGSIVNGVGVADEDSNQFRGEEPGNQAPDDGKSHGADSGKTDDFFHAVMAARCETV